MENLTYRNKHFRCIEPGEVRGEPAGKSVSFVDKKGYVPMAKQINSALLAGERLEAFRRGVLEQMDRDYRAGLYDSNDPDYSGSPSPILDPDLMPSVDYPRLKKYYEDKRAQMIKAQEALKASQGSSLAKKDEEAKPSGEASENAEAK